MNYKKILLLIVGIMDGFYIYTMNSNQDRGSKKLMDLSFYKTKANVDLLKYMLVDKADPNVQDSDKDTPLHLATLMNQTEYISILLLGGAKPNERNNDGNSPLHIAANEGNCNSIQLLLNNKANPNFVNYYRQTPLHSAIHYGLNAQALRLLLSANANPNLKNIGGNTPLHKAAMWSEVSEMVKAIQLLLQYGASVDTVNNQQQTPLQLLAYQYLQTTQKVKFFAQKMGRLLVWYQYILLPHFIRHVPEKSPCLRHCISCSISMCRTTNYLVIKTFYIKLY